MGMRPKFNDQKSISAKKERKKIINHHSIVKSFLVIYP